MSSSCLKASKQIYSILTVMTITQVVPTALIGGKPLKAKLVFNPSAGNPEASKAQLAEIRAQLQRQHIEAEVYFVRPGGHIPLMVANAIQRGIRLVIAAGGDGTVDLAAHALVGTEATLGIIPTGT